MPINVLMPALSPTMEVGNLAKWLVKEGDKVSAGDVIAEIETDKATMEVEAVDEGTVAKLVVPEGAADVPVNDVIAILAGEGEDASSAASAAPEKKQDKKASQQEAAAPPKEKATAEESAKAGPESKAAPKQEAKSERAAGETAGGMMREGLHEAQRKPNGGGRIFVSPLARRLAQENKLDLSALAGSGPHGRIVQRDIEAALKSGAGRATTTGAPGAAPAAALPHGMPDKQIFALYEEGSYELVPHDSMRKIIARRLVEAKTTIPHFYLTMDCRIDKLLALRADINAAAPETDGKPDWKVSVNDMVIKALAKALMTVPEANVTWTEGGMLKHKRADIGVAVSIPGGLITPVVRHADTKPLSTIANEMKDLAARARGRKLKPEEYQGGSSAVSNLGMFGVKDFAAVINPPHATILAVGAGEQRALVENGAIVAATVMSVTLSTDHRAVDGALGAELLGAFKRYIEAPAGMLA
jgi:pyruvate dehydrogenase E2 component (dihydrolipoamide acetyltransferase)